MIILVKTVVGDEIVGILKHNRWKEIVLEHPAQLIFGTDALGNYGIRLNKYLPYSENSLISIKKSHITTTIRQVSPELKDYYSKWLSYSDLSVEGISPNTLDMMSETLH